MRIGEFAREVGVSADTIRFYERGGLYQFRPAATTAIANTRSVTSRGCDC